ncbi:hypothetical protein PMI29_03772 [Pseudomonas sp. GM49]|nr:hypothetical protein PMI29_03772 [Pseudomonas sp. GM49]
MLLADFVYDTEHCGSELAPGGDPMMADDSVYLTGANPKNA